MGHLHPDFCVIMDDVKKGIKFLFQTENGMTLALCASGHGGMECTIINACEGKVTTMLINKKNIPF